MREPDIRGARGVAWKMAPIGDATLGRWLVHANGYHPWWTHWLIGVGHLRPLPDHEPAKLHYPEAEFEFSIIALNPEHPAPDPDDPDSRVYYLTPLEVVEQFHGITDEQAADLAKMAATLVVRGQASPDQDYRSWWRTAIHNAVEHAALGGHPKERGV